MLMSDLCFVVDDVSLEGRGGEVTKLILGNFVGVASRLHKTWATAPMLGLVDLVPCCFFHTK